MYRLTLLRLILLFPACLFCGILRGQYYFDKLTEENGLSDNRVTCFLKDKTGFLWIGTKNGLNRYDGKSFKIFKPGRGNSISSEVINDIVQDSSGKIWVATVHGLNTYDPVINRWETMMPVGSNVKGDLPNYLIWDLYVDELNHIWIVSDVWELSVYDPVAKKFTYYDWPAFKRQRIFDNSGRYRSIQRIKRKNETEWWLGTNIGLFSVNIRSGRFRFYGADSDDNTIDLEYDMEHKNVFTVTESGKLFCYDEGKNSYEEIKAARQAYPAVRLDKKKDSDDVLLMAHPDGILEINRATKEATIITHRPTLSSSLLPGGSNTIYTDTTGMVWVGTNNGVNNYNSRNQMADFIPLTIVSDHESVDGMSAAVYDAVDGRYYITSISSKEVFIIDDHSGKISSVKSVDGRPLSPCLNTCTDRENNIWLLTETNVYRYDRTKKKFSLFPTPNNGDAVFFNELIEDKEGNYWLATWNGVYLYKTKEKIFHPFTGKKNFSANNFTALMNDPVDSAVWLGTFNTGIYRYDLQKDSITKYSETPANPDYLQLNLVKDLETGTGGKVWLTTYGAGLYVFQRGKAYEKSFTHITAKKGLISSSYYSITADNKNRFWLLSGKGLSAIDQTGKFLYEAARHPAINFSNYAPKDNLPKRISYNPLKNEILVPVAGGLMFYYPDKNIPATSFPVVFTDISVGGHSVIYDSSYLNKENIEIPYKSNSLLFQFAALHYESNGNMQYEYKLHESNTEWNLVGSSNAVNFPDLPSGHYTFTVRAKNPNGHFSSASISFHINPPFWKTWWFIAIITALICFGLYKWITALRRRIRSEKILNYFATSLYGQNTVEDVFWDIAKNCITQLNFQDCVIYQYDEQRKVLIQKAAYGPKNPQWDEILNPIEIPLGKGITGSVAASARAEIIADTSKDKRYIIDDNARLSEITVPVIVDGKIFGIIDSEHPKKNFYTRRDMKLLEKIAAICAAKISRYLVEEKLRTRIARDLHDEMGSTLTSINIISKMAMEQSNENEQQKNHFRHIKEYSARMMESMSDMVWAINPANDTLEKIILRMKEAAAEILEPARINYFFREDNELDTIKLNPEQRKNLFLLYKEALTNAAKYSAAIEINISLEKQNGFLMMHIADNGKGFDPDAAYKGNGLKNMRSRAAQLKADFHIRSGEGAGTGIDIRLPITQ